MLASMTFTLAQVDQALEARAWTPRDWTQPAGLALLGEWVAGGASHQQIAERIGISPARLRQWRATYIEINRVMDAADEVATTKVEEALFRRALGFTSEETTTETRDTPTGTVEVSKTVTRQVAPDTSAATFWLKNRAPDRWAERSQVDHSVSVMEEQASQIMEVMDLALARIGLTTAQRARLPEAVSAAIREKGYDA